MQNGCIGLKDTEELKRRRQVSRNGGRFCVDNILSQGAEAGHVGPAVEAGHVGPAVGAKSRAGFRYRRGQVNRQRPRWVHRRMGRWQVRGRC